MELPKRIATFSDIYPNKIPNELSPRVERFDQASGILQERLCHLFKESQAAQKVEGPLRETLGTLDKVFARVTEGIMHDDPAAGELYEREAKPLVVVFWKELESVPRAMPYPTFEDLQRIAAAHYVRVNACEGIWRAQNPKWAGGVWFHDILKRSLVPSNVQADQEPEQFVLWTYDLLVGLEDSVMNPETRGTLQELETSLEEMAKLVYSKPFDGEAFSRIRERTMKRALMGARKVLQPHMATRLTQRIMVLEGHWKKGVPEVEPCLTSLYHLEMTLSDVNRDHCGRSPLMMPEESRAKANTAPPLKKNLSDFVKGGATAVKKKLTSPSAVRAGPPQPQPKLPAPPVADKPPRPPRPATRPPVPQAQALPIVRPVPVEPTPPQPNRVSELVARFDHLGKKKD